MDKTFTRAGVSTVNGTVTYRFANDLNRERTLVRTGHTDIRMIELGEPMTKEAAILFLNSQGIWAESVRVSTRTPTAPKVKRARAVKAEAVDDDGFVEPKDERIQVAMSRLARNNPGLTAQQLLDRVMMTFREFGEYEPTF
jgi:hypothetical protein